MYNTHLYDPPSLVPKLRAVLQIGRLYFIIVLFSKVIDFLNIYLYNTIFFLKINIYTICLWKMYVFSFQFYWFTSKPKSMYNIYRVYRKAYIITAIVDFIFVRSNANFLVMQCRTHYYCLFDLAQRHSP